MEIAYVLILSTKISCFSFLSACNQLYVHHCLFQVLIAKIGADVIIRSVNRV